MYVDESLTRILVIDDNPEIHEDYRKILSTESNKNLELDAIDAFLGGASKKSQTNSGVEVELHSALQGQAGLEMVKDAIAEGKPYALAFVDMRMPPGWDGLQTIVELWKVAPDLQVVICTAYSDKTWEDIVDKLGRSDKLLILKKPFDRVEVSQLAVALTEKWLLAKKAKLRQEDLERIVAERTQQLQYAATHDALTELSNRTVFRRALAQALIYSRNAEDEFAVALLDLDRFKQINDTLGHPIGDELLRQFADRLRAHSLPGDTLARLGGDEFGIIRQGSDSRNSFGELLAALNQPYDLKGERCTSGVSIGIAELPSNCTEDEDAILRKADLALYRAKNDGRGQLRLFDQELDCEVLRRQKIEKELDRAIVDGQLILHYQPIYNTMTGQIETLEALVRWRHPTLGLLSPDEFIPIAEHSGKIVALGEWVLNKACLDASAWPDGVSVTVNVSSAQFALPEQFLGSVHSALESSGLPASRLEIELTESILVVENEALLAALEQLRNLGVNLALDDFGTGHSSLIYLRKFKFDSLKLDRNFVIDCNTCEDAAAILHAVAGLGRALNLRTTAEGVETREQLEQVAAEGYSRVQGFYLSEPKPVEELPALFSDGASLGKTPSPIERLAGELPNSDNESTTFKTIATEASEHQASQQ